MNTINIFHNWVGISTKRKQLLLQKMSASEPVNRVYNRAKVSKVIYNDRCGYAVVFYEPIYDLDMKIPALGKLDLQTIPLQPRHLKPAGRPVSCIEIRPPKENIYEEAQAYMRRREIERTIDEIKEKFFNVHELFKKAEKFDQKRREVISPRIKNKIRGKNSYEICDVLVDDVMQNVDYVYERNLEETGRCQSKIATDCCKRAACEDKNKAKIDRVSAKQPSQRPPLLKQSQIRQKSLPEPKLEKIAEVPQDQSEPEVLQVVEKSPVVVVKRVAPPSAAVLRRRHRDLLSQRAMELENFELLYGQRLRRLKREIREFKMNYC